MALVARAIRPATASAALACRGVAALPCAPRAAAAAAALRGSAGPHALLGVVPARFATKKAGGSSKNGRDSHSKRLGVKRFGGQLVNAGEIILRQRGTSVHIVRKGNTVGLGRDHTIYAKVRGHVKFYWNTWKKRYFIAVIPEGLETSQTALEADGLPAWAGADGGDADAKAEASA